ncbi:sensor histidine kinase [Herbidospora mongoliensis]|uniref:sensor histidine kinase n=1 Tax=Herbidospora mongoliensis TaxID=688067 RepID=UPI000832E695|nr:histidine kinase [Herbidospora mongoliensis]
MPRLKDLSLWLVLCVPVVFAPVNPYDWQPQSGNTLVVAVTAGCLILAGAVAVARAHPLVALMVALVMGPWASSEALATVQLWPMNHSAKIGPLNGFTPAVITLSYLAGLRMERTRPAMWLYGLIVVVGGVCVLVSTLGPAPSLEPNVWVSGLSGVLICSLLPWAAGRSVRHRRLGRVRERQMVEEQARLRERSRIAQDVHDSLGHELALIALRAGAMEVAADLPSRHREAAAGLREAAGDATERLRRVIGMLRTEDEPASLLPHARAGGIADLVARARASGMTVALDGDADGGDPLGAAYRVVQEGLTNAAKHAPGAPVVVRLDRREGRMTVTVRNDVGAGGEVARPGTGLVGLSERVRLAGGTFQARAEGGMFEITAGIPDEAPA